MGAAQHTPRPRAKPRTLAGLRYPPENPVVACAILRPTPRMSDPDSPRSRTRVARLFALTIGLASGLPAAEGALRASGVWRTYSERNFGEYSEVYGRQMKGWPLTRVPSSALEVQTAEFRFEHAINADGVRDLPRELEAEPGRRRIVVLGDSYVSYVEGVGAERHESWPAVLGDQLARDGLSVEVLSAGVSGSDPCFAYQLLRARFLRYRPDLVILSINESDICDAIWWGGLERFRSDGTTGGRPRPRSFVFYRDSHLARWSLHAFGGLDRPTVAFGPPGRKSWEAQSAWVEACAEIAGLRVEQPFEFLVLVHPTPSEIPFRQTAFFQAFFDRLAERGIAAADLTGSMRETLADVEYHDYAWPIDFHYKARGYAVFASAVAELLRASPLLSPQPVLATLSGK